MMIDRIATNNQAQLLLNQVAQASANLNQAQSQVASGNVANDYGGYGDKTAAMEAARSAQTLASSYQSTAQLAANQTDLQDTQLSQLSTLTTQLRTALSSTNANNDGSSLMQTVQSIFQQAVQILNSTDANGNYLFGGDKNTTQPVTATTLSALAAAPSASSIFANGTQAATVSIGANQTVTVGILASDAGTQLMQTIKDVVDFNNGANGPFTQPLSTAQASFLSSEGSTAASATSSVNNVVAQNGANNQALQAAITQLGATSNLYKGFTADIQSVDLPTAISNLQQAQIGLQASLQVTAQLNNLSLLNFMGSSSGG